MTSDETPSTRAGRILAWYEAMGVDAALQETPVDWLAREERAPGAAFSLQPTQSAQPASAPAAARAPAAPMTRPPRQFSGKPPASAEADARTAAASARSLPELEAALKRFDGCGLKATAKNLCFYRGAERARLMIVGEAPGRDEDLAGKPFVGRAGMLLDKMLAAIGLSEKDVHITNIVYWRPPGNRTPTPQEALACRPFLERQAALVAPDVVLALGGAAAKQLFDVADGIMRIRGKWRQIELGGHTARAMATLHPAYLLRTPAAKGMAWRDLLTVKAALTTEH
ncbi:MAG TPA: uracil-DNA glycosylase [Hyphomicrobium sp.]